MTFLGIDGGGSKTTFLLEDESAREIARVMTGPSNWLSSGPDVARESITRGIAGLPIPPEVVCGGFAGAGRPEGVEFYRTCLSSLLPHAQLFVETDAFITYIGAIGVRPGVLLIAGTGSIAIARKNDGTSIRSGGWGPVFGDEGGGFWIGREAIRTALRAHDAGENPEFVAAITQALNLRQITEAPTAWKNATLDVHAVAALAALLVTQAETQPANRILANAAAHLREIAEMARRRADLPEPCVRSISGSLGASPVMQRLIGLKFTPPVSPPERGAILWARDRIAAS